MASGGWTEVRVAVPRRLVRKCAAGDVTESFDSEVVSSSLESAAPILRVSNKVEAFSRRVAYLCTSALPKTASKRRSNGQLHKRITKSMLLHNLTQHLTNYLDISCNYITQQPKKPNSYSHSSLRSRYVRPERREQRNGE